MMARLTRGDGITRADRGLDNLHESRRTTLPVLLTVTEMPKRSSATGHWRMITLSRTTRSTHS